MLDTKNMEKKVLSMKPIIDTTKDLVLQDESLKSLTLDPNSLPTPKMPSQDSNMPAPLSFIIPGAMPILSSELQQGPSNVQLPPKSSTKLFERKGKKLNKP